VTKSRLRLVPFALFAALPSVPASASDPGSENIPIFITDFGSNRLIRVTDMAGSGWQSGPTLSGLTLNGPWLFCLDSVGRIYVADRFSKRLIRTDDVAGNGWKALDVTTPANPVNEPHSVAVDPASGRIYMAHGSSIVRMDDMDGTGWVTLGPTPSGPGSFGNPIDVVLDPMSRLYVTDSGPSGPDRIIRFDDIEGTGWVTFGSRGGGVGQFNKPVALALDAQGRIYVADEDNHRIVRFDDMTGAGWVTFGSPGGGVGQLNLPHAIAVSDSGKIYIGDAGNQRIVRIDDMTGAGWIAFGTNGSGPLQFTATKGLKLDLRAGLSISLSDGSTTAVPGADVTYTIVVASAGPNRVAGARVKDSFPSAVASASWTCSASAEASCGGGSGSGNIDRLVTLPPGGSVTFTVTATIDPSAAGTLSNTATVTVPFFTADGHLADNSATDIDTLVQGLFIRDVAVLEGNAGATTASFTVSLSSPSPDTVSVGYATANGTATIADGDYAGASGTLTFLPGETSKTIPVTVNGDTKFEDNETFFVDLSDATNTIIGDGRGVGTISNDDAPPSVSINDAVITEGQSGAGAAVFKVALSAASSRTTGVSFATADGTAVAGRDYRAASGSLTFPPGVTAVTIAITVLGDTDVEPHETFFMNLSSPTNATLFDPRGQGTIVNDDGGRGPLCRPIVSLPYTVSSQGSYCLIQNLSTAVTTGSAITINSDFVVVDLKGFKIGGGSAGSGTRAHGVHALDRKNITVENGNIRGFFRAVFLEDDSAGLNVSQGHLVQGVRADENTYAGIEVQGRGNVVRNNQVVTTGGTTVFGTNADVFAIHTLGAGARILNNDITGTVPVGSGAGLAIAVESASGTMIENNRIGNALTGNTYGVSVRSGDDVLVIGSRIAIMGFGVFYDTATGKYRGNLTSGVAVPFTGGTDAGGNN
jgi:uncharacterized repeat protein (TIGR01451 family)